MGIKSELKKLSLAQLQDVAKPTPKPEPEFAAITKELGLRVLNSLREIEQSGGYNAIAQRENIPVSWVRTLDRLRREVIAEKLAEVTAVER